MIDFFRNHTKAELHCQLVQATRLAATIIYLNESKTPFQVDLIKSNLAEHKPSRHVWRDG